MRNIAESRIYHGDYDALDFRPVKLVNCEMTSTDVCMRCRSPLWGEIYALLGCIKHPDGDYCVAICPICMHASSVDKPLELKYFRVFRVTFPRMVDDMIGSFNATEERKKIRKS